MDPDGWQHIRNHQVSENTQLDNQEARLLEGVEDALTKCAKSQLWKTYFNLAPATSLPEQHPKSPQISSRIELRRANYMNIRQK